MIKTLEVIATTVEECIEIEKGQADRIELVSAPCAGGLTPSIALVKKAIAAVNIEVCVMVRVHEQSFEYSDFDKQVMLEDVKEFEKIGVKTIVIGAIKDKMIDIEFMKQVMLKKGAMDVVFHRAIEELEDLDMAFSVLARLGVKRVLIGYGLEPGGINQQKLNELKELENKYNVTVLLGGGVNQNNINFLEGFEVHVGSLARVNGKITRENVSRIKGDA